MKHALATLLRNLRGGAQPVAVGDTGRAAGPATAARVLLATGREDDRTDLRDILSKGRWNVVEAGDWTEALHLAGQEGFSVALCDRDLPGMDWKEGVRRLRLARHSPATILLSSVADPYLWEALVSAGAFDVLTRPIRGGEAEAMIQFAYTHWKTGQAGRRAGTDGQP